MSSAREIARSVYVKMAGEGKGKSKVTTAGESGGRDGAKKDFPFLEAA